MESHGIILMQLKLLIGLISAALTASPVAAQPSPGCINSCGNISIPYPFGTAAGCYINGNFFITCNTTFNPPKAFFGPTTIPVLDISLQGQLRISLGSTVDCYRSDGVQVYSTLSVQTPTFPISNTRNKFTAVGCDTFAVLEGSQGRNYATGCMSLCDNIDDVSNGSCSGIGCCQTSIPREVHDIKINVSSYVNHRNVMSFNPCSYAFIAEDGAYNFSSADLDGLRNRTEFPVVLDWAIGSQTCGEAKMNQTSYVCKENSECYDSDINGSGYRCNCSEGYEGNPYLSNGCRDIGECETLSPCNITCHNLPGSFECSCPKGYDGDGRKDGTGCTLISTPSNHLALVIKIALGISTSLLVLLLCSSWLYWRVGQRKLNKLKEQFFQQNGGFMLQQQLSNHEGSVETVKIFTEDDLKKATNNYHESRFLGQGGQGTVYKGILPDNKIVAIKKSKIANQSEVQQFINEVIVLSQVNHRNVVKLLGCCLETQVPLLVYEFVTNGTLFNHIHNVGYSSSLSWETRLRIATETAETLSYLHSATSIPIIHRDVKTTNILLDDHYTTKVSDFGASRLIPLDKSQLTTLVQGTLGYLDPEYFQTSQLTEKSDVYSFGVVLAELLTGKKAISFERPEEERNLAMYFISSMKNNSLFEILDNQVLNEGNIEQLKEVAMLAKSCLRVKGEERPTMKEVARELQGLRAMEKHQRLKSEINSEETELLLGDLSNTNGGATSDMIVFDSIINHAKFEFDDGR